MTHKEARPSLKRRWHIPAHACMNGAMHAPFMTGQPKIGYHSGYHCGIRSDSHAFVKKSEINKRGLAMANNCVDTYVDFL